MRRFFFYIAVSLVACFFVACGQVSELHVSEILSDGMVIQQNSRMKFWGKALPGVHVTVKTDWDVTVTGTTNPDSLWVVEFPTIKADNRQHSISVSTSDTTIVIDDVLLGEVWLASGEAGMNMPLSGWGLDSIMGSDNLIEHANDEKLRVFNVDRHISWRKENIVRGQWLKTTPQNAKLFGAASYVFAKTLRDSLNVPVGIINAAMGSTPIEAWTSDVFLRKSVDFGHKVSDIDAMAREADKYISWLLSHPKVKLPNRGDFEGRMAAIPLNDEFVTLSTPRYDNWDEMQLPCYWDNAGLGDFDGVVWFVKQVAIPNSWIGKPLELHLGAIDDCDNTYVNGFHIGSHTKLGDYNAPRDYKIPAKYIRNGIINIAIRVTDVGGQGGFSGCEEGMRLSQGRDQVSIEGTWKFRPVGEFYENTVVLFDPIDNSMDKRPVPSQYLTHRAPAAMYYGMIYPISNYNIAGVIWNQGEANVGRATQYLETAHLFVDCFRETFGNKKLPIYFAQTPGWRYSSCDSTELASLREAQREIARDCDNVEIISTLDLGSSTTINPCYKVIEGQRFARLALRNNYGKKSVTPSGPVLVDAIAQGQLMILTFEHSDSMYINPEKTAIFEVAGEDCKFFQATAVVHDHLVSLFSHAVPEPLYVRYAYRNCSEASLFNGEGLPSCSFMIVPALDN